MHATETGQKGAKSGYFVVTLPIFGKIPPIFAIGGMGLTLSPVCHTIPAGVKDENVDRPRSGVCGCRPESRRDSADTPVHNPHSPSRQPIPIPHPISFPTLRHHILKGG